MVNYDKQKKVNYGKHHREGITGMMERQDFISMSPAYNPHLTQNKPQKTDTTVLRKSPNLNQSHPFKCNHERTLSGVC